MANSLEEEDCSDRNVASSSNTHRVDIKSKEKEKKSLVEDIRSIKKYSNEDSSDDGRSEIADIISLPDISRIQRKEDKYYQHLLLIDNGIYDGTINQNFLREGQGTFSINNGEEYYSGSWMNNQPHGYGFQLKNHGATISHGQFQNGTLKRGYGKEKLFDHYQYQGEIEEGKFHGLGSLTIRVEGLQKDVLQLVAQWKEGKTTLIYQNEVEECYLTQYEVFSNGLQSIILLTNEDRQKQREYLQILIDLFEKQLSNLNLLREISSDFRLPRQLKSSADLLYKLDHSYTNLKKYIQTITKKTYTDLLKDTIYIELKTYARKLAWEEENKTDGISSKYIFADSLNNFLIKSQISDLKKVLALNPSLIALIRKLVRFANLRLIVISSQNRSYFIHFHQTFLKDLWSSYLQTLQSNSISNQSDEQMYHFYSDCYSIYLELSFINQSEIKVDLIKLKEKRKNTNIEVILNEEIVFQKETYSTDSDIYLIVFDGVFPLKITEKTFSCSNNGRGLSDLLHFIDKKIDPKDIFLLILSYDTTKNLNTEMKRSFEKLGSRKMDLIENDMAWIFLKRKNGTTVYEKISDGLEYNLSMKQIFQLNLNENLSTDAEIIQNHIESSIAKAMIFALNHLKPWEKLPVNEWSSYFNQTIQKNISIKELGDRLLVKILKESKEEMRIFVKEKNLPENKVSFNYFESMIDYYEEDLLKDKSLNYQSKMKEIKKILHYFFQIFSNDNHQIRSIIEFQLELIKEVIQKKQTVTEIIDHFLDFNREFVNLSQTYKKHFPSNIHMKFSENSSQIISLVAEIFKLVLHNPLADENAQNFEKKLYAMQKMNNFLTNLGSLDISWFVEGTPGKDLNPNLFQKMGEHLIYKVLNIERAKIHVKDSSPHYLLEIIIELLQIIKNVTTNNRVNPLEVIEIRADLIMGIEKSFKYLNDQIKYTSLVQFKEDCVNPFKDVTEDIQSYEIFSQKLEKVDLYFLYNRKLKEIDLEQALQLFQQKNPSFRQLGKIKKAFLEYRESFRTYFSDIMNKKISIKVIIDDIKKLAKKENFPRQTIPHIIAFLSVVLSLMTSDFIKMEANGKYLLKDKYNEKYFLQPHCIQILGVLMLLDAHGEEDTIPPNHLAEILTGQGKSWALTLLAGYFSLTGYEVTVACYSDYLSRRDEIDFEKNFSCFQFENKVIYRTFNSMCNEKLTNQNHNNKTLRDLISDIVSGKELFPKTNRKNSKEKSILLIDEVDVFFSKKFGSMYNPSVQVRSAKLAQIQKDIWQNLMNGQIDKTKLKHLVDVKIVSLMKDDPMLNLLVTLNFFKFHIEEMINTAIEIHQDMTSKNTFREKYKLIDDTIHVKDSDGKYVSNRFYRYESTFYYLKLKYEREENLQKVSLDDHNYGYLLVKCGTISYSELPNSYQRIFGVSGSLKNLSPAEESVLIYYQITERSYYPSFFGHSKLVFDEKKDFLIKEGKKDWFDCIIIHARKVINEERSVLIFFDNEEILDEFYNNYSADLGIIPYFITQNKVFDGKEENKYTDIAVNKLIKDEFAGHHGKVTLLTKEFGRGVDFQSETKVNEKGGIHVIQTFFSNDIKEEIQIKGRTARKDQLGSYQLILCLDHLLASEVNENNTILFININKDTTYDQLDRQRKEKTDLFCQDKLKQIENNQQSHKKTLAFFEKALTQCNDTNREDFITEIMQLGS